MKNAIELFREENLPLAAELYKLGNEYDEIIGAQTIEWDGEERTLAQMIPVLMDTDRAIRQEAWTAMMNRRQQDRDALNALWVKMLKIRQQIAQNAGFDSYTAYRWKEMGRLDYTPEDCVTFQQAIEEVVVPVAQKIAAKRCEQLGIDSLRPWDTDVDPLGRAPLRPFAEADDLEAKTAAIFNRVDPELGNYFAKMRQDNLLDLANRKGKAPGGYCESLDAQRKPFIFMNSVGVHDDVQTMLHEGGHAFHVYETAHLPYHHQMNAPMEFCEVASMAMEFLGAPYLDEFYTPAETARARTEHIEQSILFWPYMAIVDAFQHWVYNNIEAAADPAQCDAQWHELSRRFQPYLDWTGYEAIEDTGWHRKLHIYQVPFYYVEYGLAQLGAVQVWHNALSDQAQAVVDYRKALALGGTVRLPELFSTAGAKFAFDAPILHEAVALMERVVDELATP